MSIDKKCQNCKKEIDRDTYTICGYSMERVSVDGFYYFDGCQYINKFERRDEDGKI